jgi:hypothetical protein
MAVESHISRNTSEIWGTQPQVVRTDPSSETRFSHTLAFAALLNHPTATKTLQTPS